MRRVQRVGAPRSDQQQQWWRVMERHRPLFAWGVVLIYNFLNFEDPIMKIWQPHENALYIIIYIFYGYWNIRFFVIAFKKMFLLVSLNKIFTAVLNYSILITASVSYLMTSLFPFCNFSYGQKKILKTSLCAEV